MQTRRFGRTEHQSSLAILGTAAFWHCTQEQADSAIQMAVDKGVNHFDVAPSYGQAEERLRPWVPRLRNQIFLGCKTMERTREGADSELHHSLEQLQTDHFDLYQIHAITSMEELDLVTSPGGALEGIIDAQKTGLIRFIGITGHGVNTPAIFLEALKRYDFDSVLFPLNFVQYTNAVYRENAEKLLQQCRARDVGVMVIKSISRSSWGDHPQTHNTWYRPFTDLEHIQSAVNFALTKDVTGICTAGDMQLLPLVLQACQNFTPMNPIEQEHLIASASQYEPLFA
jgi:predicted aldo/keto reductase-like oxidoreductase